MLDKQEINYIRAVVAALREKPHLGIRKAADYVSQVLGCGAKSLPWLHFAMRQAAISRPVRRVGRPPSHVMNRTEQIAALVAYFQSKSRITSAAAIRDAQVLLRFTGMSRTTLNSGVKDSLKHMPSGDALKELAMSVCWQNKVHLPEIASSAGRPSLDKRRKRIRKTSTQ